MADGTARVELKLSGEHNVTNALAAAGLAGQLGMSVDEIGAGFGRRAPEQMADGDYRARRRRHCRERCL